MGTADSDGTSRRSTTLRDAGPSKRYTLRVTPPITVSFVFPVYSKYATCGKAELWKRVPD